MALEPHQSAGGLASVALLLLGALHTFVLLYAQRGQPGCPSSTSPTWSYRDLECGPGIGELRSKGFCRPGLPFTSYCGYNLHTINCICFKCKVQWDVSLGSCPYIPPLPTHTSHCRPPAPSWPVFCHCSFAFSRSYKWHHRTMYSQVPVAFGPTSFFEVC